MDSRWFYSWTTASGQMGFVINNEKSNWVQSQRVTWLGLEINTGLFSIKIKRKRVEKFLDKISEMRQRRVCSARQISSIAAGIISQEIVLGPVTGLFTRKVFERILVLVQNIERLNSKALGGPAVPVSSSSTVNSDASHVACGAVLNIGPKVYTAHKNLSEPDKLQSTTWRELDAVLYALKRFAPILSGRTINRGTDNQAVPIISKKGSNKQHLKTIARDMYYACRKNDIHLIITWVPRDENVWQQKYLRIPVLSSSLVTTASHFWASQVSPRHCWQFNFNFEGALHSDCKWAHRGYPRCST